MERSFKMSTQTVVSCSFEQCVAYGEKWPVLGDNKTKYGNVFACIFSHYE